MLWVALLLFCHAEPIPVDARFAVSVVMLPDCPANVLPYLAYPGEPVRVPFASAGLPRGECSYCVRDSEERVVEQGTVTIPAGAGACVLFELRGLPEGPYTFCVFDRDRTADAPNAFSRIAVLPRPADVDSWTSPFGLDCFVNFRLPHDERKVRLLCRAMKKAGVHWVRDRLVWDRMEPQPGQWVPGPFKTNLRIQAEEGLHVLAVFHDTALWASSRSTGDPEAIAHAPPSNPMDLGRFLARCVAEFGPSVAAYEIWNEFDIPVFFTGTADEYASCLKAAFGAIKAVDPDKVVVLGSATMDAGTIVWGGRTYRDEEGAGYVGQAIACGAADFCDALNVHYYGPARGYLEKVQAYRRLFRPAGRRKPVWVTEVGLPATRTPAVKIALEEREQAVFLRRVYEESRAAGIGKVFFFSGPNFVEHEQTPWGILHETPFGWEPKLAFYELARLAADPAFAQSGEPVMSSIPASCERRVWADVVVNRRSLTPDVREMLAQVRLFWHGEVEGRGQLRVEASGGGAGFKTALPFDLGRNVEPPVTWDVCVPVRFPAARYDMDSPLPGPVLKISGRVDGCTLTLSPVETRFRWAPSVELARPGLSSGALALPVVQCELTERTGRDQVGTLSIRSMARPETIVAVKQIRSLRAGQCERVLIECPAVTRITGGEPLLLVWTPHDGTPTARAFRFETDAIPGTHHYLEGVDNVVINTDAYTGDVDLSGRFTVSWTPDELTFHVRVRDEDLRNDSVASRPWIGDCVELFVDLRPPDRLGRPAYEPGVAHIAIVPAAVSGDADVVRICEPAGGLEARHVRTTGDRTADGYALTVVVKANPLAGEPLRAGRPVGIEVVLDDIDAGEWSHRQMVWRGGQTNWFDASRFSRMMLVDAAPQAATRPSRR